MLSYSLTDVLNLLMIIGILATWFHYVALRPLKQMLFALKDDIQELTAEIKASREDRRSFEARISKLETAQKILYEQLNELKHKLEMLHKE